jgi:hypothetical protein
MNQTTVRPRDSSLKIDYRPWEKMFLHERDSPPLTNVVAGSEKIQCEAQERFEGAERGFRRARLNERLGCCLTSRRHHVSRFRQRIYFKLKMFAAVLFECGCVGGECQLGRGGELQRWWDRDKRKPKKEDLMKISGFPVIVEEVSRRGRGGGGRTSGRTRTRGRTRTGK